VPIRYSTLFYLSLVILVHPLLALDTYKSEVFGGYQYTHFNRFTQFSPSPVSVNGNEIELLSGPTFQTIENHRSGFHTVSSPQRLIDEHVGNVLRDCPSVRRELRNLSANGVDQACVSWACR
jgi:hypothetical protein